MLQVGSKCKNEERVSNLRIIGTDTYNSACPWSTIILECTVNGDNGSTVWQGSAFDNVNDCHEITLLHTRFNSEKGTVNTVQCNNGAIIGWSVNVTIVNDTNHYNSQLAVIVKPDMNGKYIGCFYDDGKAVNLVGSRILNISTSIICMHTSIYDLGYVSTNTTSIYMGTLKGT